MVAAAECIPMTDILLVVFTAFIAVFTFLLWLVYKRIEWLTGSMETYTAVMLRIEAARGIPGAPGAPPASVPVIWWDPNVAPFPFTGAHDAPANLERIYLGVPRGSAGSARERSGKNSGVHCRAATVKERRVSGRGYSSPSSSSSSRAQAGPGRTRPPPPRPIA